MTDDNIELWAGLYRCGSPALDPGSQSAVAPRTPMPQGGTRVNIITR